VPASLELPPDERELLKGAKRASNPFLCVCGETVGEDHAVEILDGNGAEPDLGQCV
jgi:hypothetical protein